VRRDAAAYPEIMLTDEQIHEIASQHIARFGGDLRLSRPIAVKEPDGIFYKVERPVSARSTNLVNPFVVLRADGRIASISAGDVMPGVVTKLWGWAAMRSDPDLQKAVIDPDFSNPRHIEVWGAMIKEVLSARSS
jgi:hypothetical protein